MNESQEYKPIPQVERLLKDLGVRQYNGPPWCRDQTGVGYSRLLSAGVVPEGSLALTAISEEDAIASYVEQLQKFLSEKGASAIIWRARPTLELVPREYLCGKKRTEWIVYSRLTCYADHEFKEITS